MLPAFTGQSDFADPAPTAWLSIRYEGLDADDHQLDLHQLGVSLQGLARILAVCSHFAQTGRYSKQFDALAVRVVAAPVQQHRCYEVLAVMRDVLLSPEVWAALLPVLVQVVFERRGAHHGPLSQALEAAMAQNAALLRHSERLLDTVDRMVEALRPAARQALAPVGSSCACIGLYAGPSAQAAVVLDERAKAHLSQGPSVSIQPTRAFEGLLSEIDLDDGTCRVSLSDGLQQRVPAEITDPLLQTAGNPYAMALARQTPLRFLAKATVDAQRAIVRLHISDVSPPPPGVGG